MTVRQFVGMLEQVGVLAKMESGETNTQQKALTGNAAHEAALREFGRK